MKVLFIGATGVIGRQVVPILKEQFELTLVARGGGEIAGLPANDLDITDFEATEALVKAGDANGEPFDAIVNCAIAPYKNKDLKIREVRHAYAEDCIEVNARGAYHIYEAAARAEVPKVVYIASMTAVLGHPFPDFIDESTRDHPANIYASAKLFGEHVGRYYAYRHENEGANLQVICLRLGQPYRNFTRHDEKWPERSNRGLVSHFEDIAQGIQLALELDTKYGVYPIISASDTPFVDPKLYAELGYSPRWTFTSEGIFPVGAAQQTAASTMTTATAPTATATIESAVPATPDS
jgi:nucleoside-diphosphate-sugar epimerase